MNAKPVFIDTNILFYAHDKDAGEKHEKALQAVLRAWSGGVRPVMSVQVLQELLVNLRKKLENDSIAVETVSDYLSWRAVDNDAGLFLAGIDFMTRYQLSF